MTDSPLPFNTILASTVHDMKNSLGMMLESLHVVIGPLKESKDDKIRKHHAVVQYEASRLNGSLMQLLALYKLEQGQLMFRPSYHNLYDFLDEQFLTHAPLLKARRFDFTIDVDSDIEAVFDETLMSMAIGNILGNAIRYAHSKIELSVVNHDGLTIRINDDGPGYPAPMLEMVDHYVQGVDQSSGSTGLGLYFAQQIARLHTHGEKQGYIGLINGGRLGGGLFSLTIP